MRLPSLIHEKEHELRLQITASKPNHKKGRSQESTPSSPSPHGGPSPKPTHLPGTPWTHGPSAGRQPSRRRAPACGLHLLHSVPMSSNSRLCPRCWPYDTQCHKGTFLAEGAEEASTAALRKQRALKCWTLFSDSERFPHQQFKGREESQGSIHRVKPLICMFGKPCLHPRKSRLRR